MTRTPRSPRSPRALPSLLAVTVAGLALLLTATGGAVAGTLITGAQIKNGSVTGLDVKDRSLSVSDLSRASKRNLTGPRGARGATGAPGVARGWAHVAADGTLLAGSPGVVVDRGRVSGPGRYCVRAPGVDATRSAPVATPDFAADATATGATNGNQAFVEVRLDSGDCATGSAQVVTMVRSYTQTGVGELVSTQLDLTDQPFTIVIP